jgi:trehalose 6-phosphate phosphatase
MFTLVRNILLQKYQSELNRLLRPPLLLGFDFDGTLSPIVTEHRRAGIPQETRRLLKGLITCYPCAILTGRSLKDAKKKLAGFSDLILVGNHGAEISEGGRIQNGTKASRQKARLWKKKLMPLKKFQGIDIEDKEYSLSIHYKKSKDKEAAVRKILKAVSSIEDVELIGGKDVFNLVDPLAPSKGDILLKLMKKARLKRALFVGDDITDESVFRLNHPGIVSVRVGSSRKSKAKWYISKQRDMNRLLRTLLSSQM